MAKKSMILKQQAEPKFSTRRYNRCKICGRPHAYLRYLAAETGEKPVIKTGGKHHAYHRPHRGYAHPYPQCQQR